MPYAPLEIDGFRVPDTTTGLSSGVHTYDDPHRWVVVSREEHIEYEIREVPPGGVGPALAHLSQRQHCVVDRAADTLYGGELRRSLDRHGVRYSWHQVAGGEGIKTLAECEHVIRAILAAGACRRDLMVGVGGGATLDFTGVVAALIGKGAPLALVPTTPTAYVDASVGVKRAVNLLPDGKNSVGVYYEALHVLLDRTFMRTVSAEHTAAGCMEILKMALITGGPLWHDFETHAPALVSSRMQCPASTDISRMAIHAMLTALQPNLREHRLARNVDLGHLLVSHLELLANVPHGIAVGTDLALMVVVANLQGSLTSERRDRVLSVIEATGAPICHPLITEELVHKALEKTRRNRAGAVNLPVPEDIGRVVVQPEVDHGLMASAVKQLRCMAGM